MKEYFEALDGFLQMDGKLQKNFDLEKHFSKYDQDDEISFDDLFDIIAKWAINEQTELSYEDFAKGENEQPATATQLKDFKKMTDRVV